MSLTYGQVRLVGWFIAGALYLFNIITGNCKLYFLLLRIGVDI